MNSERGPIRLGIVGTGGIGRLHATLASKLPAIDLVAISDLDDSARSFADSVGAQLCRDYRELGGCELDAVVVAAPNRLHLEVGAFCAEAGMHLLVEKPIAESVEAGHKLCQAADDAGVHLLVGHHRRYQNLVRTAQRFVQERIGKLVATSTLVTMRKPDSYYEIEWRRSEGAGPLLVNLIHEVDLLRAVCGEIVSVQAMSAKIGRDFAFDDSAVMTLRYESGALGTLTLTESTPSPWSWEASVSDGMGFYNAGQDHMKLIGTEASLSFPSLTAWTYASNDPDPGWESPLTAAPIPVERNNPYVEQLEHLADVVHGAARPAVTGWDALRSLSVVDAVIEAAATGTVVEVDPLS